MTEKFRYTNDVTIKFSVFTTNNKIVDRVVEKLVKLLNKNDIGADVQITRTFESYPIREDNTDISED
jgi:hypothetical protein